MRTSINPDSLLIRVHLRIAFLHHRQHHLKRHPHALLTLHGDLPIVIANNGVNNRQPQTRALVGVFCHKKRLKKTLTGRLIHPYPIILYLDNNRIALEPRLDPDPLISSPNSHCCPSKETHTLALAEPFRTVRRREISV